MCICSLIADSLFKLFPVVVVKMLSKRQPDSPNSPDLSTLLRHYEFKLLDSEICGASQRGHRPMPPPAFVFFYRFVEAS